MNIPIKLWRRVLKLLHFFRDPSRWDRPANHNSFRVDPDTIRREFPESEFAALFLQQNTLRSDKWASYLVAYERHLAPFRNGIVIRESGKTRKTGFIEIGVHSGGSLQVFSRYFSGNANLYGIDINPECAKLAIDDAQIRIGNQIDSDFLTEIVREMGKLDVVIDDGSHRVKDQFATFKTLWPYLSDGGVYIVEDLHTSYWRSFGGGYKHQDSFIEIIKDSIDGLHKWHSNQNFARRGLYAKTEVLSITLYDSLVVFEKCSKKAPMRCVFGAPPNAVS